jgi:hypothetical protein
MEVKELFDKDIRVELLTEEERLNVIKQSLTDAKKVEEYVEYLKRREESDKLRFELGKIYEEIVEILKIYCDLPEPCYNIITLWIIGTYLHQEFESFPFLYFNAMKGSGKTRVEKLISHLAKGSNGEVQTGITEAALFRSEKGSTLVLDECEGITSKESQKLREYINAAYKKGATVLRNKKVKKDGAENYVIERFEPYRPIVLANINGMEDVLQDRCMTLILEKSQKPQFIKLIEDFSTNPAILSIKAKLLEIQCRMCMYVDARNLISKWNFFIKERYIYTQDTYIHIHTIPTYTYTPSLSPTDYELFNRFNDTNIDGRNLELSFPLFIIANFLNEEVLFKTIDSVKEIMADKREQDFIENKDVALIDFVSQRLDNNSFYSITSITNDFREFLQSEVGDKTINPEWVGRALKRLKLVKIKKRQSNGIMIILDVQKAQDKIKMFKG